MKKFFVLGIICSILTGADAYSAGARTPTAGARGRTPVATQNASSGATAVATRGRTGARAASNQVSGAKNVSGGTAVLPGQKTNTAVAPKSSGVSARAATKQKVVNSGTKIAGATENTVVSEECKNKYYGCMDSFCMLDNTNGGRCLCSNRNAELETVLADIEKLDNQSYELATRGVENINMGDTAADINAIVDNATKSITDKDSDSSNKKSKARKLNLDAWNVDFDSGDDMDEVFSTASLTGSDDLSDKKGDALHSAVMGICAKQIPECSSSMNMLKMMYAQQIRSDCSAYENSLKQQKAASTKKLQTAQQAMRDAALEQYQNANKYDLPQCTIRFTECMKTTAGCGDDFSKCASDVALENAKTGYGAKSKVKKYTIKTGASGITIAESTYNTLSAKKVMCDTVLKQCQKVQGQVWNSFLTSVAPDLKSAELIAESNIRTNCISEVSACFQQACKDTMDPNNPEGSYDMCLSRPDTMKSVCKVQLETCEKADSNIWEYIQMRLSSMRVDACTKEFKACLTDENRCGKDYTGCVGLDTDTIIGDMCPIAKLTACNVDKDTGKKLTQTEIATKLGDIFTGIMLNIDNNMLTECQNALTAAMVKVCGDSESCDSLALDFSTFDANAEVRACELNAKGEVDLDKCYGDPTAIDPEILLPYASKYDNGLIKTAQVNSSKTSNGVTAKVVGLPDMNVITYTEGEDGAVGKFAIPEEMKVNASTTKAAEMINNVLDRTVKLVKSDPKVDFCVTGRKVQGLKNRGEDGKNTARFPNLAGSVDTIVVNTILQKMAAYNASVQKKYEDQIVAMNNKITEQIVKLETENLKNAEEQKVAGEESRDKQNAIDCIKNYTTWTSARKCPKVWGKNDNSGEETWIDDVAGHEKDCKNRNHIVNAYIKEFTEDVASYDASTNTCKVQTVKYSCHSKDGGYYRSPWCIRTNSGTVMSTREIKMATDTSTTDASQ